MEILLPRRNIPSTLTVGKPFAPVNCRFAALPTKVISLPAGITKDKPGGISIGVDEVIVMVDAPEGAPLTALFSSFQLATLYVAKGSILSSSDTISSSSSARLSIVSSEAEFCSRLVFGSFSISGLFESTSEPVGLAFPMLVSVVVSLSPSSPLSPPISKKPLSAASFSVSELLVLRSSKESESPPPPRFQGCLSLRLHRLM